MFLSFVFFFRATPEAYGRSLAGVKLELQLWAYTTVTATLDPNYICALHHNFWQHWILNPLREARDRTRILMNTSWVLNPLSHNRNPSECFFFAFPPSSMGHAFLILQVPNQMATSSTSLSWAFGAASELPKTPQGLKHLKSKYYCSLTLVNALNTEHVHS